MVITIFFHLQGVVECELCKFLIQAVDKLLVNNKTVDAINSTLQKVCQSLPGNLGDLVSYPFYLAIRGFISEKVH